MAAFILAFKIPGAVFGPVIAKAFIVGTSAKWRCNYCLGIATNAVAILLLVYYHPTYIPNASYWQIEMVKSQGSRLRRDVYFH
jgi:hypothetical protein